MERFLDILILDGSTGAAHDLCFHIVITGSNCKREARRPARLLRSKRISCKMHVLLSFDLLFTSDLRNLYSCLQINCLSSFKLINTDLYLLRTFSNPDRLLYFLFDWKHKVISLKGLGFLHFLWLIWCSDPDRFVIFHICILLVVFDFSIWTWRRYKQIEKKYLNTWKWIRLFWRNGNSISG